MTKWITNKKVDARDAYRLKQYKKPTQWITKKTPEIDLDYINEILKEPTEKAKKIFKSNYKKGGLVKKGKPKLAKRGWK